MSPSNIDLFCLYLSSSASQSSNAVKLSRDAREYLQPCSKIPVTFAHKHQPRIGVTKESKIAGMDRSDCTYIVYLGGNANEEIHEQSHVTRRHCSTAILTTWRNQRTRRLRAKGIKYRVVTLVCCKDTS